MATNGCNSTFADLPVTPILHYWGIEIVTPAKRFSVSSFLQQHSKADVLEFLHATFPDKRQIILVPSGNGNNSSLDTYSFETLEEIVHFKPQVESVPIIHDGNRLAYESLRNGYLSANDDEKHSSFNMITDFVHHELFENISSNIHKGFASWTAADVGPLLLLNNRKVYSTDQSKCKAVSNRNKKTVNTQARSRLPPTQRNLTPAGKPRRHISDSEPSSDDLQSSDSSLSETYKTYGKHTDSEMEDGEATPVLPERVLDSLPPVPGSTLSSGPPSLSIKSHRPTPGRRNSKTNPADFRKRHAVKDRKKSSKKSRKSRKNRKASKRARRHSSPSSAYSLKEL